MSGSISEMTVYVVFLALGVAGLLYSRLELRRARDSKYWFVKEGDVVDSAIEEHRSAHCGTSYSPNVRYRYSHEGVVYEGTRIMFSGLSLTSSRADVEQFLVPFAKGARITVYVSPRNPRLCVIAPGIDRRLKLMIFVSSYFVFMGGGGLLGWWH